MTQLIGVLTLGMREGMVERHSLSLDSVVGNALSPYNLTGRVVLTPGVPKILGAAPVPVLAFVTLVRGTQALEEGLRGNSYSRRSRAAAYSVGRLIFYALEGRLTG